MSQRGEYYVNQTGAAGPDHLPHYQRPFTFFPAVSGLQHPPNPVQYGGYHHCGAVCGVRRTGGGEQCQLYLQRCQQHRSGCQRRLRRHDRPVLRRQKRRGHPPDRGNGPLHLRHYGGGDLPDRLPLRKSPSDPDPDPRRGTGGGLRIPDDPGGLFSDLFLL